MQHLTLDLAVGTLGAGGGIHIHGAAHLGNRAGFVLHALVAADDVRALEAHLEAGVHPLELLGGHFHEVILLDVDFPAELHRVGAHFGMIGVILHGQLVHPILRPVGQHHLEGAQHRHGPGSLAAQVIADAGFQQCQIHHGVGLAHADAVHKVSDGRAGVAPAAQGGQGRHAGIIPSADIAALHQLAQVALGHDRLRHVQAGELNLPGTGRKHVLAVLHHPVIQGAVDFVFQRAHGVADALQRVANGVGEVVHGIDTPLAAGAPVLLVQDAVHGRVAHDDIGRSHVDLCAQGILALGEFAGLHAAEQVKGFLPGAVAPGAVFAGLGQGAAVGAHLLLAQFIHIGQAPADPVLGNFIALVVVIAGVIQPARPVEAQPLNVALDGLDILGILLGGVGIIKAKVAQSPVLFGGQEVHDQRLAVADVHIAVGLGRKARMHLLVPAFLQVLFDGVPDKVAARGFRGIVVFHGKQFLLLLHSCTGCIASL